MDRIGIDLARMTPAWWQRTGTGEWTPFDPSERMSIQTRWRVDGPLEVLSENDTLSLAAVGRSGGRLLATLPPLAPTDLTALRVQYSGTQGGPLRLAWRGPKDEAFTHGLDRVIAPGGDAWHEVTLPFGAPFRAQGSVAEIALLLPGDEVGQIRLHSSELLLRQPLAAAAPKVAIDGQLREAIALGSDRAVEWECELPKDPELHFDYGVDPSVWRTRGDGVYFEAWIDESRVWTQALDPFADPAHRRWLSARIDLSEWSGQRVKLRVVALASAPARGPFPERSNSRGDAPLLSAPRVVPRRASPPRVLMIVIDTLRADALGTYGREGGVSPRIDALAARGIVFERAWAASSWTHPSTASFLSGWVPSRHGLGMSTSGASRIDPSAPWLPRQIREAGWATAAVSNNVIVSPDEGFARGFDHFDERVFVRDQVYGAQRVTRNALEWLEGHGNAPYFLYLHYFDPHDRYQAPPPFTRQFVDARAAEKVKQVGILGGRPNPLREALGDTTRRVQIPEADLTYMRGLYDGEVAYVDHWIGVLLDRMRERGWLENTLIVLTSDHGEEFLEHGFLKHGHALYEEQIRVPLIVVPPTADRAGQRLKSPVSLLDLPKTLMDFVGQENEFEGLDLLGALPDSRPIFAEMLGRPPGPAVGHLRAVIEWPFKLIENLDRPRRDLFDLQTDATEQAALGPPFGARGDSLRASLDRNMPDPNAMTLEELPPDPALIEKLKAMGYVH